VSFIIQRDLVCGAVPTGKEIKDRYLEKLFAPEFPFESIRIIVTKEEEKYVIIKAKENITDEAQHRYENETLRKRKITITRHYRVKDKTLAFSEMMLYRVVSEIPYVVEFSNIKGKYLPGNKSDDVLKRSRIPADSLIFSIQINKRDESIPDYSFIKIFYSTDPDENKRTIEKMNTQYKNRSGMRLYRWSFEHFFGRGEICAGKQLF